MRGDSSVALRKCEFAASPSSALIVQHPLEDPAQLLVCRVRGRGLAEHALAKVANTQQALDEAVEITPKSRVMHAFVRDGRHLSR